MDEQTLIAAYANAPRRPAVRLTETTITLGRYAYLRCAECSGHVRTDPADEGETASAILAHLRSDRHAASLASTNLALLRARTIVDDAAERVVATSHGNLRGEAYSERREAYEGLRRALATTEPRP
jgi:hypothetical protein